MEENNNKKQKKADIKQQYGVRRGGDIRTRMKCSKEKKSLITRIKERKTEEKNKWMYKQNRLIMI